jgi:hypothetical protein
VGAWEIASPHGGFVQTEEGEATHMREERRVVREEAINGRGMEAWGEESHPYKGVQEGRA